jgi:murein DD-endopeptidase MepM/ murein hydrolase activator NlpD
MANTNRQTIISPQDLGPQNVFVINDINLVVPPTQIEVNKEDLVYQWRTLRTKASTKIPSGHGQIRVSCHIVFPQEQLLALHRLIVQFRHSPFCYVDNRYLRESIVPDWPVTQNMAFCMTGIMVQPMQGSSDTWSCQLDMTWFNYFPYMHNYLYREEWQTNFLHNNVGLEPSDPLSFSIGWTLNPETYKKVHAPSIVGIIPHAQSPEYEASVRAGKLNTLHKGKVPDIITSSWSLTQNEYKGNQNRTIFDMEVAHAGVEWDMVPLPDNMKPSRFVTQPKYSRIYVRYINLLQRDALIKNFGIDVEADIAAAAGLGSDTHKQNWSAFFSASSEKDDTDVHGLHTMRVPRSLREKWTKEMLQYNFGVRFNFHALKEIKFPQRWSERIEEIQDTVFGNLAERVQAIRSVEAPFGSTAAQAGADEGLVNLVMGPRAPGDPKGPARFSSEYGYRIHPLTKVGGGHSGVDIRAAKNTPLIAIEAGEIVAIRGSSHSNFSIGGNQVALETASGTWWYLHLTAFGSGIKKGVKVKVGDIIGTVGTTGRSTGDHLHLTFYPTGQKQHSDPRPVMQRILVERGQNSGAQLLASDTSPTPLLAQTEPLIFLNQEAEQPPGELEQAIKEAKEQAKLPPEEEEAIQELLTILDSEGWKFYDRDTTISNVWEKLISLTIAHSGADQFARGRDLPEQFVQEGVVITHVSGSLQHIVAQLPILSREYPTQQHLGSIEPQYEMQFAVLDDRGDLEGLPAMAQLLEGMRSQLQSNARRFRPVLDGWCVSTDTFVTRLFGSYEENDITNSEENGLISDFDIKKRTVVSRASSGTIPGQPGLSMMTFIMEETNPYIQEVLSSTSPTLQDKEEARKEVLGALWRLDFIEKHKKDLFALILAQAAGANIKAEGSRLFGKGALNVYQQDSTTFRTLPDSALDDVFVLEDNGQKFFIVRQRNTIDNDLLNSLGLEFDIYNRQTTADTLESAGNPLTSLYAAETRVFTDLADRAGVLPSEDGFLAIPFDSLDGSPFLQDFRDDKAKEILDYDRSYLENITADALYFDIAPVFEANPQLFDFPIEKVRDYYVGLKQIVKTANRFFAESEVGGLTNQNISDQLYCLPVEANMWKSWQSYIEAWIVSGGNALVQTSGEDVNTALRQLYLNTGYPRPQPAIDTSNALDVSKRLQWEGFLPNSDRQEIAEIARNNFGALGTATGALGTIDDTLWGYLRSTVGASFSSNTEVASTFRIEYKKTINRLVNRYMRNFPIQIALPEFIKSKYQHIIGDLFGSAWDERGKVPALESMHDSLYANIESCGHVRPLVTGNPYFETMAVDPVSISPDGQVLHNRADHSRRGGFIGGIQHLNKPIMALPDLITSAALGGTNSSIGGLGFLGSASPNTNPNLVVGFGSTLTEIQTQVIGKEFAAVDDFLGTNLEDFLYPEQVIGTPKGSSFKYPVSPEAEGIKVKYIKTLLAEMADDMLQDADMLRLFGKESLLLTDRGTNIQGSECYPDLDLPTHPFYGDSFQVSPDFYMWNIYQDGGALSDEDQEQIYNNMDFVIQNCYNSMKKMEDGDEWNSQDEKAVQEPSVDDPIITSTQVSAEGSDAQNDGSGATSSTFAPTKAGETGVADFNATKIGQLRRSVDKRLTSDKPSEYMPDGVRLSATEGSYGAGGGLHYPTRVAPGVYQKLQSEFDSVENMFGSKAGFANQVLSDTNSPRVSSDIKGTNLERPPEYAHTFDPGALKKLARDSAKDLIGQKMSLRRAFPTFKLFFIEEDEFESRFLNFNDFTSYNAVKEFTVVMSRKIAADHATIVVQNISGSLDGTRRNAIVDLDYFDKTAGKKLEANDFDDASSKSGDPITKGTAQDQPFGAVVLRPGLNVQLRCGYANDPDNLHVMVSGRVVDVTWNKTGDLAEIMVQSFGAELVQQIKGTARDEVGRSFASTHELLGSMMLEPEVVHFGRWEFGQTFQIGEAKDHRLDFTDYSKEGFLGKFKTTRWLTGWLMDHPWMTFGAALGLTIANFLPVGRLFGGGGRLVGGGLAKFGIGRAIGKEGTKKLFTGAAAKQAGLVAGRSLTPAGRQAMADLAFKQLGTSGLYGLALKSANPTFQAVLRARKGRLARDLANANTIDDVVSASLKMEQYLQTAIFKGQWMSKPWVSGVKGALTFSSIGPKPIGALASTFLSGPPKIFALAAGAGIAIDLVIENILNPIVNNTIGRVKKFFARTKATLFLSPQDDNLFPPHPKDYMVLDRSWFSQWGEAALISGSRILFQSDEAGLFGYRFFHPREFLSKKVDAESCNYQLTSTTIWQTFHEMSLRHPGWIYGARPYGTKFRYTMFFGIPSQRYWAKGASNQFIDRANRLRRFLAGRPGKYGAAEHLEITESEFTNLYGDGALFDLKQGIDEELHRQFQPVDSQLNNPNYLIALDNALEAAHSDLVRREMLAIPLREYLRALEIRFQPFRRYHLFSSERDIVWNGIMGSEQAVSNAVDVQYYADASQRADTNTGKVKTAIFKAHAFIPEHQLRIAPVRWPNCKGYRMAMRYGMGELLHRMRDMYRGEIIVLGNPRIRPWDIAILADSYNDMVGPIEVEQVVHMFSHETGFITEVKPAAVLFANEISGWPMVEAMKMFAMAVRDIEDRYNGVRGNDAVPDNADGELTADEQAARTGFIGDVASYVNMWGGEKYNSFIEDKYKSIFGEGASLNESLGPVAPNTQAIDSTINDAEIAINAAVQHVDRAAMTMGVFGSLIALGGTTGLVAGTVDALSAIPAHAKSLGIVDAAGRVGNTNAISTGVKSTIAGKAFFKNPKALVGGAVALGGAALAGSGFGSAWAIDQIDFPSLIWLVGGPILFLQCLRNDSIIVVPLMKDGNPIVTGLSYNDPSMLWKNFRGDLNRWVTETVDGTKDMVNIYRRYGSAVWSILQDEDRFEMTGENSLPAQSSTF